MANLTNHEAKLVAVHSAMAQLVAAFTALEGTAYFKLTIVAGTGAEYTWEVAKKGKTLKPRTSYKPAD